MDVRSFVKETLLQIVKGVEDAQKEPLSGVISPRMHVDYPGKNPNEPSAYIDSSPARVWPVRFDLSVTVDNAASEKGGALAVLGFGAFGGSRENKTSSADVSRISFEIPVYWPNGLDTDVKGT